MSVSDNQLLAEQMRQGMRYLASGVCVMATEDASGARAAMTVSSVSSVSDSPPSLLVCVNTATRMSELIEPATRFSVSVLSVEHQALALVCASSHLADSRFEGDDWSAVNGMPFVKNAPSVFFCRLQKIVLYGTHKVCIADIEQVNVLPSRPPVLTYLNGSFGSL